MRVQENGVRAEAVGQEQLASLKPREVVLERVVLGLFYHLLGYGDEVVGRNGYEKP